MNIATRSLQRRALGVCVITMLASGCAPPEEQPAPPTNPYYDIGTTEYSDLAVRALTSWAQLDFDAWGATLSDDVEFYFPDGDAGTRTSLIGKDAVLEWWRNWKATSGIQSMTFRDHVDIPVIAKETLPYSGQKGPLVTSYFSNELVYGGATVNLRMNVVVHFNPAMLIDRVYTYYDRTKITQATGTNILTK